MEGKRRCKILKNIRQSYAQCYSIEYYPEECNYLGECSGSCKRCEEEVDYLVKKKQENDNKNSINIVKETSHIQPKDVEHWHYVLGQISPDEFDEPEKRILPWPMEPTMDVVGIKRHRIDTDGAGVRTLVAVSGCPLRCKNCLNPHSWNGEGTTKTYSAFDLLETLLPDELYFDFTGGGVTFGGGEPLLYAECISEFAEKYGHNFNIVLETSLYVPLEKLKLISGFIEQYIVDIKSMNPAIYKKYTGKEDNQLVLDNLKYLLVQEGPEKVLVRIPKLPGYTSEDITASVEEVKRFGITNIDVYDIILPNAE